MADVSVRFRLGAFRYTRALDRAAEVPGFQPGEMGSIPIEHFFISETLWCVTQNEAFGV